MQIFQFEIAGPFASMLIFHFEIPLTVVLKKQKLTINVGQIVGTLLRTTQD
jgi:hypothetical protein